MGLYDVIDDIATRQILKTETGDNRMIGLLVGTVVNNFHKEYPGRVCVQIPVRDKDANELKWAQMASPAFGKNWGMYFLPEVGDQVLVAFEQGNMENPYVMGCIPMDEKTKFFPEDEPVLQYNQLKKICTRNGNSIVFEDGYDSEQNQDPKGKKDKIKIQTGTKDAYHQLILDNENQKIQLSDKSGNNSITISTGDDTKAIALKCEKKLTIQVGDKISMTLNGESGAVSIKCDKFQVDATDSVNVSGKNSHKLSGASVKIDANSSFKVESAGVTALGGNPVKLG